MSGGFRYTGLRAFSIILKIAAVILVISGVLLALSSLPFMLNTPLFVYCLVAALVSWAVGELIMVFIHTEQNTREMVTLLRQMLPEDAQQEHHWSINGVWAEPVSYGERWRPKFGKWRPERPIPFDDPDAIPLHRGRGRFGQRL